MRDHAIGTVRVVLAAWIVAACSKGAAPPARAGAHDSAATPTAAVATSIAAPPGPSCMPTGLWAPCSVLYRLERSGLAPRLDSAATVSDHSLHGLGFVVKIGMIASLDVYLYPDSAARIADEQQADRKQYVTAAQPQTMRRERTIIENANLVALLTSINDHQRERVSDALVAGAPQAPRP